MRVLAILALVAVFLAVSVQGRVVRVKQMALTETAVQAGGPLSYGFACAGLTDTSCQKNLRCEADSGTPPQKKTGFICLMKGEGDMMAGDAPAAPAVVAAAAAKDEVCPKLAKKLNTSDKVECKCEAQCNDGFVCVLPEGKQVNMCRPPKAPAAAEIAAIAATPAGTPVAGEGDKCDAKTPCKIGTCMTKAAYQCRLSAGKDEVSCNKVAKSTDPLTCKVIVPLSVVPAPPANSCSNKGEYTFWQGPNASNGEDGDKDARGSSIGGTPVPFKPCCGKGIKIAAPAPLKGQYGFVIGQLAQCP
jgi:hypothetical protein